MSVIKNVAIAGASGSLGAPVLDVLIKSNKFNVTVLTRADSTSTSQFPSSVTVLKVDYNSISSLTSALQNIDAVVSCVSATALHCQDLLVDASIAAGVKRFLPSEFGSDLGHPRTKALPVFAQKVAMESRLEAAATQNLAFTYTLIRNGPFLDWGLKYNFLLDLESGNSKIYDGGEHLFSATTLETIGLAVVAILEKFEETKNRVIYIQDIQISQNQLLKLAKQVAPEKKWESVPVDTATILASSNEKLAKGEVTMEVMMGYINVSIFGTGYGAKMKNTDNELLGLKEKTDADLVTLLKKLIIKQ